MQLKLESRRDDLLLESLGYTYSFFSFVGATCEKV